MHNQMNRNEIRIDIFKCLLFIAALWCSCNCPKKDTQRPNCATEKLFNVFLCALRMWEIHICLCIARAPFNLLTRLHTSTECFTAFQSRVRAWWWRCGTSVCRLSSIHWLSEPRNNMEIRIQHGIALKSAQHCFASIWMLFHCNYGFGSRWRRNATELLMNTLFKIYIRSISMRFPNEFKASCKPVNFTLQTRCRSITQMLVVYTSTHFNSITCLLNVLCRWRGKKMINQSVSFEWKIL